jgi:hypothetical protein
MNNEQSEFGKGLAICLVKFAEHRYRWVEQKRQFEKMKCEHPDLFTLSSEVEMHFNGASDHLFEIEVPKEWQDKEIGKKVKELQDFSLEIGHGFASKEWTEKDIYKAYELCQEIALLLDTEIGLKPDKGQW